MNILAVSAKKQGGKSTLLEIIKKQLPSSSCEIIRFADTLKQIVIDCFVPYELEWEIDDLDLEENKNVMLPCGKTVREMLQKIGTDWFRHAWEDCWINTFKNKVLKSKASYIFVPDCRFPNELKAIQEMGGIVIRLTRAPFAEQDQHESETALDELETKTLNWNNSEVITDGFTIKVENFKPGDCFNLVYDNKDCTLLDAGRWARNFVDNCFTWDQGENGAENFDFDLSKIRFTSGYRIGDKVKVPSWQNSKSFGWVITEFASNGSEAVLLRIYPNSKERTIVKTSELEFVE